MEEQKTNQSKNEHPYRVRNIILATVLVVLLVGTALGVSYVYRILKKPQSLFTETSVTPVPEKTALAPVFPLPTDRTPAAPSSDPTPEPTAIPVSVNTDEIQPKGVLNILLTGIDAYESGGTTSGSMPHTDSMMVIAINFDKGTVDLISVARDLLTTAPGHYGYYKLNGVFNVGVGYWSRPTPPEEDLEKGFQLTCRALEQWLGGISIPYYYGLDFQAVIDIVNAIGGIDYDVDHGFTAMYGDRHYGLGMHHLDGNAVIGYLRLRHSADGLDSSRTARQRRMMIAIFKKLKNEGKLSQIPALINAANSGIYTNTTLAQTTALVNYAMNLDEDKIQSHGMYGDIGLIEYDWRYVYVDQQNRIDLIKEIYGIDAEPVGTCTRQYERWLHDIGFLTMKRLHQIEKVLKLVEEKKNAGETFTDQQIALYGDCYLDYLNLHEAFESYSNELAGIYPSTPWREKKKDLTDEQKQEDAELTEKEKTYQKKLVELSDTARKSLDALAKSIGYRNIAWSISGSWYNDTDVNEVYVNFG